MRPAYDRKLQLVEPWVADLELAIKHCRNRRQCVQAGGAYGLWPLELAKHFEYVATFEPDQHNFDCLVSNVIGSQNILAIRGGLGRMPGNGTIHRDAFEADNAGAGYVVDGNDFPIHRLDSFGFSAVDLICLDVEGFELFALQGAENTIETCRPVIMVEAKELPQMTDYGVSANSAIEWLMKRGYQVVERVHRDVVLVHASHLH